MKVEVLKLDGRTARTLEAIVEDVLMKALEANDWNLAETARQLNFSTRGLEYKLRRMGIESVFNRRRTARLRGLDDASKGT